MTEKRADFARGSLELFSFLVTENADDDVAELVGVRRETIGKLENGKYNPSLKLAMDIAKVFGKTVEEVFAFEEDSEDEEDE